MIRVFGRRRVLTTAALTALCGGCETGYSHMMLWSGVRATQITDDTVQILARGNMVTAPDTVRAYVLRKAAEVTVKNGYDLFRIDGTEDETRAVGVGSWLGQAHGRTAGGISTVGTMYYPAYSAHVTMLKGPRPEPMPADEYDAREVLRHLGPQKAS